MPTYDYRCNACGHTFEEMQKFSDPVLTKCPECGKKKLERLFGTGAAVLFKGSGFYETDYRSDNYKSSAKADAEASKPATPASTDAASKPAGGNDKTSTPKKSKSDG